MRILSTLAIGAYASAFGVVNAASAEPLTLLALGDSLTAGYNLPRGQGFAPVLERELRARGHDVRVIDGGVSGDTTAGGLARIDWMTAENPDAAIVELGANDALRGLSPEKAKENLAQIIEKLKAKNIDILLAGMLSPPNMGGEYVEAFNAIYPSLSQQYGLPLYPFFLDGVAAQANLLQNDGLHPTKDGVERIVQGILPQVEALLKTAAGKTAPEEKEKS